MTALATQIGRGVLASPARRVVHLFPGLALCAVIALAGAQIAGELGGSAVVFAVLAGMCFSPLTGDARYAGGVDFAECTVLKAGIGLLGARLSLGDMAAVGAPALVVVAVILPLTIAAAWWLARRLGMGSGDGVMAGASVAVCGSSAALAVAAGLPPWATRREIVLATVIGVTALSTVAMLVYPLAATPLGLDDRETGVLLGATIHGLPQAVGAGFMVSEQAGDAATVTKLLRVALLAPVVLVAAAVIGRREAGASAAARLTPPGFLIVFVALAAAASLGWLAAGLVDVLSRVSGACLLVAMAALGARTTLAGLTAAGWRPAVVLLAGTLLIAVAAVLMLPLAETLFPMVTPGV